MFADYDADGDDVVVSGDVGGVDGVGEHERRHGAGDVLPGIVGRAAARRITSYSLDGEFLQDINVMTGLSRFLFENDTEEAYFFLGLDGAEPAQGDRPVSV